MKQQFYCQNKVGNHDIHGQKKNYTHVAIQVQAFRTITKFKASTEVKETASVITSCQKTFAETWTTLTNYSICMEQSSFITSKCETQSGKKKICSKFRILHALLHKLRKKRARKTSIVQANSKVTFHTITSSIRLLSRAISLVWPVNT